MREDIGLSALEREPCLAQATGVLAQLARFAARLAQTTRAAFVLLPTTYGVGAGQLVRASMRSIAKPGRVTEPSVVNTIRSEDPGKIWEVNGPSRPV